MITRRAVIATLGGLAATWPRFALAQSKRPVIGFLHQASQEGNAQFASAFRQGLRETGFIEGQNVAVEYRWGEGQYERLPRLAAELVGRDVALIFSALLPATRAAEAATATIPIVFVTGSDPVTSHLVASLSRPGGNATGASLLTAILVPKRVELLHELLPGGQSMGVLINPRNPNADGNLKDIENAARAIGLQLHAAPVGQAQDFEPAIVALMQRQVDTIYLAPDTLFTDRRAELAALAIRHKVPMATSVREVTDAGVLMHYGANQAEVYRQAAAYVGRILKGERPANLPVLQPTKFELVINLKTAKAIGLTVPPALLARADEVIE